MRLSPATLCSILAMALPAAGQGIPRQGVELSESVNKLIRKPRRGPARLELFDGTRVNGYVLRVTNRFATLRNSATPGCENIELSKIARIDVRGPGPERYIGDVAGEGIIAVLSVGDAIHRRLRNPADPSRFIGYWRATQASPSGSFRRVGIGLVDNTGIIQRDVAIREGRYRIESDKIQLISSSRADEVIPFRFECAALVLESPDIAGKLTLADSPSYGPAGDPIVGTWQKEFDDVAIFRADGTFQIATIQSSKEGHFKQTGSKLHVTWNSPSGLPAEEWGLREKAGHLFLTAAGVTSEYAR